MELGPAWMEWGMAGLFLASFLAATILPLSSEALLLGLVAAGGGPVPLLVVATIGNTLGGLTNYGLGRWVPVERILARRRPDPVAVSRWTGWAERYGPWGALLCWLPVVGDVIALALGVVRAPFLATAILMLVGKAVRYMIMVHIALRFMSA